MKRGLKGRLDKRDHLQKVFPPHLADDVGHLLHKEVGLPLDKGPPLLGEGDLGPAAVGLAGLALQQPLFLEGVEGRGHLGPADSQLGADLRGGEGPLRPLGAAVETAEHRHLPLEEGGVPRPGHPPVAKPVGLLQNLHRQRAVVLHLPFLPCK